MQRTRHSRPSMIVFAVKRAGLQLRRLALDLTSPVKKWSRAAAKLPTAAESKTDLWTDAAVAERRLQLGKVQNLRIAIAQVDGIVIPAGGTFSFWKQIGRARPGRGFTVGRELREGCMIPAVGGGLCQLSNALYELALQTGCEIVERHGHSVAVPGSAAAVGRDATVAWNYIDLRFRPRSELQIRAELTADELIVRFHTKESKSEQQTSKSLRVIQAVGSCVTCGESECLRHAPMRSWSGDRLSAFVLDSVAPEWQRWLQDQDGDFFIPIDGSRWRMPRYAWGHKQMNSAPLASVIRAWRARMKRKEAPAVVRADQLASDIRVAQALGSRLQAEHEHLIVAQSLLPGLWLGGYLGGRTYSVLMVRLPFAEIHRRLDEAIALYPHQELLGDFRASDDLVEAERAALARAEKVITPHPGIAKLFQGRAELLDWAFKPEAAPRKPERIAVFAGPTAARKGAYAVREACRRLNLAVIPLGKNLEGSGFWDGIKVASSVGWLERASVVVQPSISEDRPISLLKARNAGIPIVATDMCGLRDGEYVRVDFGDVDSIVSAIELAVSSLR